MFQWTHRQLIMGHMASVNVCLQPWLLHFKAGQLSELEYIFICTCDVADFGWNILTWSHVDWLGRTWSANVERSSHTIDQIWMMYITLYLLRVCHCCSIWMAFIALDLDRICYTSNEKKERERKKERKKDKDFSWFFLLIIILMMLMMTIITTMIDQWYMTRNWLSPFAMNKEASGSIELSILWFIESFNYIAFNRKTLSANLWLRLTPFTNWFLI